MYIIKAISLNLSIILFFTGTNASTKIQSKMRHNLYCRKLHSLSELNVKRTQRAESENMGKLENEITSWADL